MQDSTPTTDHSELMEDVLCAFAYITILPAAIFLFVPAFARNPRVRFHACQSVFLNWLLTVAVFGLGITANAERILSSSHGAQTASAFIWTARILCMGVWATATIRIATGRGFSIPGLAALAQRQANGRLFSRLEPVSVTTGTRNSQAVHAH